MTTSRSGPEGEQASNAWRVLGLLLLANLLNQYDRVIPAVIAEPMRIEFGLSDVHLGLVGMAFIIVYALAGVPLARIADLSSRKILMAGGLAVWSAFTAFTGWTHGLLGFTLMRIGVGVGEATLGPAATSMIGDLFPSHRRSRAVGIYMLGLPLGLVLGFFTVGAIATAFGSWRAPFFLAAPPGLLLAVVLLRIREPARGAADAVSQTVTPVKQPVRTVLRIRTMWWLILSGVGYNFATYATGTFLVPLMQRHFHFDLRSAAITAGVVLGLSGLIAMTCGGFLADAAHKRNDRGRLWLSAAAMLFAAVATWAALRSSSATGFVALFGIGWLLAYLYSLCIYPVIQELVVPRLRATAMAVYFAAMYVLGGAFGSIVVGAYSDHIANSLMVRDGLQVVSEGNRAAGLHGALVLVPLALLVTAFACWMAGRTLRRDMALAKG